MASGLAGAAGEENSLGHGFSSLGAYPRNGCALSSRNKGLGEEGVAT